jgi:hypothetical protein
MIEVNRIPDTEQQFCHCCNPAELAQRHAVVTICFGNDRQTKQAALCTIHGVDFVNALAFMLGSQDDVKLTVKKTKAKSR